MPVRRFVDRLGSRASTWYYWRAGALRGWQLPVARRAVFVVAPTRRNRVWQTDFTAHVPPADRSHRLEGRPLRSREQSLPQLGW